MTNWRETIDVSEPFRNNDLDLEAKTRAILNQFKQSQWYQKTVADPDYDDLGQNIGAWVEEMEYILTYEVDHLDVDLFDAMWGAMYDLADEDKIWVNVWSSK